MNSYCRWRIKFSCIETTRQQCFNNEKAAFFNSYTLDLPFLFGWNVGPWCLARMTATVVSSVIWDFRTNCYLIYLFYCGVLTFKVFTSVCELQTLEAARNIFSSIYVIFTLVSILFILWSRVFLDHHCAGPTALGRTEQQFLQTSSNKTEDRSSALPLFKIEPTSAVSANSKKNSHNRGQKIFECSVLENLHSYSDGFPFSGHWCPPAYLPGFFSSTRQFSVPEQSWLP